MRNACTCIQYARGSNEGRGSTGPASKRGPNEGRGSSGPCKHTRASQGRWSTGLCKQTRAQRGTMVHWALQTNEGPTRDEGQLGLANKRGPNQGRGPTPRDTYMAVYIHRYIYGRVCIYIDTYIPDLYVYIYIHSYMAMYMHSYMAI